MRLRMSRRLLLVSVTTTLTLAAFTSVAMGASSSTSASHATSAVGSGAAAQADQAAADSATAQLLAKLTRGTPWTQTAAVALRFDTFHPQGMVRVGDHYFMTAVQILQPTTPCNPPCDGYDRTPGAGIGHLFEFDAAGNLLHDLHLAQGNAYHPGGIDYDGRYLWVPLAEYRPRSHAIIYRVDPTRLVATEAFQVNDHIGAIVHDLANQRLIGANWGSRTFYVWNLRGKRLRAVNNPEQFIDYQDCHYLPRGKAVCGGVANITVGTTPIELGGVSLLDLRSLTAINTVPVTPLSPAGHSITRNPIWLQANGMSLQLQAVPDDDTSSLLTFNTPPLP
jgi:hypothetical protein